ncbi:hypothetical protein GJ496_009712 [Pomphorhynchus laevis]|nr:hypothetical protein GJ496_009712 [Pomphorhynchus laevis]
MPKSVMLIGAVISGISIAMEGFHEELSAKDKVRELTGLLVNVDEDKIHRFLRASNNNVEQAAKMLKEDVEWRENVRPDLLKEIDFVSLQNAIEILDECDLNGNPVIVIRTQLHSNDDSELFEKYMIFTIENVTHGINQCSVIFDLYNLSWANTDFNMIPIGLSIFHKHYADLLSHCFILRPNYMFNCVFGLIRLLLDNDNLEKIHLIRSEDEFDKFVDRKILPSDISFHMEDNKLIETMSN